MGDRAYIAAGKPSKQEAAPHGTRSGSLFRTGATEEREMNRMKFVAGSCLVVLLTAASAFAQADAKPKEPPKPALGPSAAALEQWNDIGRKLIAIAEDLPEDKYDYKPHPDSRTFVGNLLHASASMYFFTDPVLGQKARYGDDPKRDELKTKAQVVAFVKKCVQDGADAIKAKGDAGMAASVYPGGPRNARVDELAYGLIEHSGEHYGQLVVYYRANGMVPPESRPKK